MTLRTKTLLIVSLVLSTLLMAMFCTSRQSLRARFAEIERQESEETASRTRAVMSAMLEDVDEICRDWAGTHQSATQQAMEGMGINVRGVFTEDGAPVSLLGWNSAEGRQAEFPPALAEYVENNRLWWSMGPGGLRGLVLAPLPAKMGVGKGVLLISAHPAPQGGMLLMGRWLDSDRLMRLTQSSALVLAVDETQVDGAR